MASADPLGTRVTHGQEQTSLVVPPSGGPVLASLRYGNELERGPHHQVLQTITEYRDASGGVSNRVGAVTVLGTGMFYENKETGRLEASREEIEVFPAAAVARHGAHKAIFPLTSDEAVDIEAERQRFRCQALGLLYWDSASDKSVWVAELDAVQGQPDGANRWVYADAFTGLVGADLVYEYRRDAIIQDVVVRSMKGLASPQEYGLDPATTLMEVVTEFYDAPEPEKERRELPQEGKPVLVDDQLRFGTYQMAPGRAVWMGGAESDPGESGVLPPVLKRWEKIDGRTILFESVPFEAVAPWLEKLPRQASVNSDAGSGGGAKKRVASAARVVLPPQSAWATQVARASRPWPEREQELTARMAVARGDTKVARASRPWTASPGLVWDYTLMQSASDFTFQGNVTYLVTNIPVNLSGTTTISAGAVVKFLSSTNAMISCSGPVVCNTGPYRPAVFTAASDKTVGEPIPGYDSDPYAAYHANPALKILQGNQNLHDLRFAHASIGVLLYDTSAGTNNVLRHLQFVHCDKAIWANGYGTTYQDYAVRNVLIHNVSRAFYGYSFKARVEHLTLNQYTQFSQDYQGYLYGTTSWLYLTNSLMVGTGNMGTVTNQQTCCQWTTNASVLQAVGAGYHYLPSNSPYLNSGTTNLNADLASDLRQKTTEAPQVLSGLLSASTTLGPYVFRDTRSLGAFNLGYHYDPIDRAAGGLLVSNATGTVTITLTNSVAIGTFNDHGIELYTNAVLLAEGTPQSPVRLFRFNAVQEQSTNWGNGIYEPTILVGPQAEITGGTTPIARMRFAAFSGLGGYGCHLFTEYGWWGIRELTLRDCQFFGNWVKLSGDTGTTIGLTNNLFERVRVECADWSWDPVTLSAYNNLFRNGSIRFDRRQGTWTFRDNAFHETGLTDTYGGTANSHNTYIGPNQGRLTGSAGNDVAITNAFTYASGPLGDYYHSGTNLMNAGSRNADVARLYHHTVQASQVKETNGLVDIGFHYMATVSSASKTPVDTDSDGLADWCEDRDSDGSAPTRLGSWG